MFTRSAIPDLQVAVDLVNAMYGWDMDVAALLKLCDDLLQTEWAFNAREGYGPEHDRLPEIFSNEPLPPHNTVFDVDPEEMAGARSLSKWRFAAINISVELHGLLAEGKNRRRELTCEAPLTVRALLDLLELDPQAVGMVVVNRKLRGLDHTLQDGDHILIAPFLQGG